MKFLKIAGGTAAVLVLLAGVARLNRDYIILHAGHFLLPHIGPNHPVNWDQGPSTAALPPNQRPPNVIVILADDMGFNDITLHGGGIANGAVPTPNIDSIAHEGVELRNGYAGNATCAPSRAAIMTGRYATRFGFEFTPAPVAFARIIADFIRPTALHKPIFREDQIENMPSMDHEAIPLREITIAALLQKTGYHTLHFGKWHLGAAAGNRPEQKGFDESLGFTAGASMFMREDDPTVENSKQDFDPIDQFLWANLPWGVQYNGSPWFEPAGYMTDYLTREAITAVHANRNRPFFMYFAPNAVHTPLQATREDYAALPNIADHRLRVYGAMMRNLDRNVGRLLQTLKEEGLDQNTLIIFTSDNGGANYIGLPDINRPYRGWKATFFEGGLHVPYFMRWPGHIPTGVTYDAPVGHVDIFATAAAAAAAPLPADRKMDGVDLVPYVTGQKTGQPHQSLFWRSGEGKVVLAGGWKLQRDGRQGKQWLFNLAADPTERQNLVASEPAKLLELSALLDSQNAEQAKPLWPTILSGAIAIDHPGGVETKLDDEYIYWDN